MEKLTPPVIVFGGGHNAVSIVRQLGRRGVSVYTLNKPSAPAHASRYARRLPLPGQLSYPASAESFLLGTASDALRGAVVLAASDDALEVLIAHHAELSGKFVLDACNVAAQSAMLNKLETYRIAARAGVPVPRYRMVAADATGEPGDELAFPLLVKPVLSHHFQRQFRSKFFLVRNPAELTITLRRAREVGIDVLLMEQVPGPDSLLCSYYTYLDEEGTPLFDFTKRILRRYPAGMGLACYHITDHVEGVKDLSLRLFREAGLVGVANAEFKRDERDGQLKLIECNARFTAPNCLLASSGVDLSWFVYARLTGRFVEPPSGFRTGVRLWDPLRDAMAFLERRRTGDLTFRSWLASVAAPQTFPMFAWSDPLPSLKSWLRIFSRLQHAEPGE